ncbi:SyrB-like regulator [Pseudorhizobium pelagicum]|uniref:SyrB-like regulator n=1 Tax=Pseudorhizobium pelagicum TaxID=1509405 RepID=UPI001FD91AD8|nr:SyrB-like regulator [Pseudorhizobium pelagicum]
MLTRIQPSVEKDLPTHGEDLMAEENNAGVAGDIAQTDVATEVPAKKQRAPRRQKAAVEASKAAPVKRRKRLNQDDKSSAQPAETAAAAPVSAKAAPTRGRSRTPKQVEPTATTPDRALDDMADLIQLEEENKRLRKTLADKLRQENADLRKRLNLD